MYADRLIVGASVGLADLGVYSYAQVVPEQARGFAKGLNWLFVPELTRMSDEAVRRMFVRRMWQFTATVAAGVVAYVAVAPLLYRTLFPAFAAAAPYSQVLALALLALPSTLSVSVLQARKVSGGIVKSDTLNAVINIGLLWLLVPGLGLWGAVVARVAGRVAAHLLLLVLVRRYLDGSRPRPSAGGALPSVDAPA
jgi:O-antigen/teichoic acid export membrane protein